MKLTIRLLLEQLPDDRTTARAIDFPDITVRALDRKTALASAHAFAVRHLNKIGPPGWFAYAPAESAETRLVPIELTPAGDGASGTVGITVGILIVTKQVSRGRRFLVTSPNLPSLSIAVEDMAEVNTRTIRAVAAQTKTWDAAKILKLDQTSLLSVAEISVTVDDPPPVEDSGTKPSVGTTSGDILSKCGICLTGSDPGQMSGRAYQRESVLDQVISTLGREANNSLVLVGPPGVGKTAIVYELAARINSGGVPDSLKSRALWFVTANSLIAGQKFTGEWQGRIEGLIAEARSSRAILYMGDPEQITEAGRWSQSDNNMSRSLRPHIETGSVTVICECTPEVLAVTSRLEPSFAASLRRIDVNPLTESDTSHALAQVARRLEERYDVGIDPSATSAALEVSRKFLPYRSMPGKAIEVLRDCVVALATTVSASPPIATVTRSQVISQFARTTGLPEFILSDELPMDVATVRGFFTDRLIGQPEAVEALVDLITVIKAGLNDPNKPLGTFFFAGPTGVGKTESAKVLAEFLFGNRDRMHRLDMSEYAAADALPKLIGSAWQRDKDGDLTRRIREQPFSVVLLDEIEKANRDVYDALLAVLGEGRLTTADGHTTDFRNSIVIMTSNLGVAARNPEPLGFGRTPPAVGSEAARVHEQYVNAVRSFFRPEFVNRIDRLVAFRHLDANSVHLIVRRELGKMLLRDGFIRRDIVVDIDDAAVHNLAQSGYHPSYGARPLQRLIERTVIVPLARHILSKRDSQVQVLRIWVDDGTLQLELLPVSSHSDDVEHAQRRVVNRTPVSGPSWDTLAEFVDGLLSESESRQASESVNRLRREAEQLLEWTHQPTFWNDPSLARTMLGRIYAIERVLKRVDTLVESAAFLEERARQIRLRGDQRAIAHLIGELQALAELFSALDLELATVTSDSGLAGAALEIRPLGRDSSGWSQRLRSMYEAWARLRDLDVLLFEAEVTRSAQSELTMIPFALGLFISGGSVAGLLAGESGIHRLTTVADGNRRAALARVVVRAVEQPFPADSPAQLSALRALMAEPVDEVARSAQVVRSYVDGARRHVRDPRTAVRVTDFNSIVNDGHLDPFILAYLQGKSVVPD
jgi:ATP-dependent Clp protease ATP-binding subunit ClpC